MMLTWVSLLISPDDFLERYAVCPGTRGGVVLPRDPYTVFRRTFIDGETLRAFGIELEADVRDFECLS
jgi:hypothetical protein